MSQVKYTLSTFQTTIIAIGWHSGLKISIVNCPSNSDNQVSENWRVMMFILSKLPPLP